MEVRAFSVGITRFLLDQGCEIIVAACNTASAASLQHLRQVYPDVPFVGMEPAVKPAAEKTSSGVVGVLATPATFQGELYASVVERFAGGVKIVKHTCPGLVELIESGHLESSKITDILSQAITPMLNTNADTIVLGCTHYPFVIQSIQHIAGQGINVIDPAPAVARQAKRVFQNQTTGIRNDQHAQVVRIDKSSYQFFTSGDPQTFHEQIISLLAYAAEIRQIEWVDSETLQVIK